MMVMTEIIIMAIKEMRIEIIMGNNNIDNDKNKNTKN